jgi:hypothetical protein
MASSVATKTKSKSTTTQTCQLALTEMAPFEL